MCWLAQEILPIVPGMATRRRPPCSTISLELSLHWVTMSTRTEQQPNSLIAMILVGAAIRRAPARFLATMITTREVLLVTLVTSALLPGIRQRVITVMTKVAGTSLP